MEILHPALPPPPPAAEIERLLATGNMQYLYNVDVTSYAGKARTNYNFNGEAEPAEGSGEWQGVSGRGRVVAQQ